MKKRRNYRHLTPELRAEALKAVDEGTLSGPEVAEAFGVSPQTVRRWRSEQKADLSTQPLTDKERAELRELRKRAKKLEQENTILKKFAAFSASQKK